MPRTVSLAFALELAAQESSNPLMMLLKINHAQLPQPLWLVRNSNSVTSNVDDGSTNQTYQPFPFDVKFPIDSATQLPQGNLIIDAVDLSIITAIRSISTFPTCKIMLVLASQPNVLELALNFDMRQAEYDAYTVSFSLTNQPFLNEPHPADTVTPANLPGLFR